MSDSQSEGPDGPDQPWPPPGTGGWLVALMLVALAVLAVKLYPFGFAAGAGPVLGLRYGGPWAVAGQVALFLPVGFVEAQVSRRLLGGVTGLTLLLVGFDALLLSLIAETVQHWQPARTSSVIDLLANMAGGVAGGLVAAAVEEFRRSRQGGVR